HALRTGWRFDIGKRPDGQIVAQDPHRFAVAVAVAVAVAQQPPNAIGGKIATGEMPHDEAPGRSVGFFLQLRIGEELHRLHLWIGRLRLDLVDPRAQLRRHRLALFIERVGIAANHAFAVRNAIDVPHLDAVRRAACRAYGAGDEALGGDLRFLTHATFSDRPR